jgi:hypothetical protein
VIGHDFSSLVRAGSLCRAWGRIGVGEFRRSRAIIRVQSKDREKGQYAFLLGGAVCCSGCGSGRMFRFVFAADFLEPDFDSTGTRSGSGAFGYGQSNGHE